jgi:taurine dioxygenase
MGLQEDMDQAVQDYAVTLLASHTGAEVRGIDLRGPIDGAVREHLNRIFVDHSVLVIRDQKLSAAEFLQAMQLFGDIFPQHNPRFRVPECPMIHYISNQDRFEDGKVYIPGEGYHTDHSNDPKPPKATALHAVKLPKSGGDTRARRMRPCRKKSKGGSTASRLATCTKASTANGSS